MKIKNVQEVKNLNKEVEKILNNTESTKSSKIKDLFQLGLEVKEISEKLGIRYNFAYNVISNYIITDSIEVETTKQESKKDIIKELYLQDKTCKEIAITLKTNMNYVYKILKEIKNEIEIETNKVEEEEKIS